MLQYFDSDNMVTRPAVRIQLLQSSIRWVPAKVNALGSNFEFRSPIRPQIKLNCFNLTFHLSIHQQNFDWIINKRHDENGESWEKRKRKNQTPPLNDSFCLLKRNSDESARTGLSAGSQYNVDEKLKSRHYSHARFLAKFTVELNTNTLPQESTLNC